MQSKALLTCRYKTSLLLTLCCEAFICKHFLKPSIDLKFSLFTGDFLNKETLRLNQNFQQSSINKHVEKMIITQYVCCTKFFISGYFYSFFVSTSLAFISKPEREQKIIKDEKLTQVNYET